MDKDKRTAGLKKRSPLKAQRREKYLQNIQKTLWHGHEIPNLPISAVTDLATEIFSSSCGARKLNGLHLPDVVQVSCKGRISPCSLVLALIYLERLKSGGQMALEFLSEVTPSELFIISMLVANKFLQDDGDSLEVENWFWANLSDFSVAHINVLEKEFLSALKWEVFVNDIEFWQRLRELHRTLSFREGSRRGWFSYEEISSLLDKISMSSTLAIVIQVSTVCLVSYCAAFITLFGATVTSAHIHQYLQPSTLTTNLVVPDSARLHNNTVLDSYTLRLSIPNEWLEDAIPSWKHNTDYDFSFNNPEVFHNDSNFENHKTNTFSEVELWHNIFSCVAPAATLNWLLPEIAQEHALLQLKDALYDMY